MIIDLRTLPQKITELDIGVADQKIRSFAVWKGPLSLWLCALSNFRSVCGQVSDMLFLALQQDTGIGALRSVTGQTGCPTPMKWDEKGSAFKYLIDKYLHTSLLDKNCAYVHNWLYGSSTIRVCSIYANFSIQPKTAIRPWFRQGIPWNIQNYGQMAMQSKWTMHASRYWFSYNPEQIPSWQISGKVQSWHAWTYELHPEH